MCDRANGRELRSQHWRSSVDYLDAAAVVFVFPVVV